MAVRARTSAAVAKPDAEADATTKTQTQPQASDVITHEQLATRPDWVAINGQVFDLAKFAPKHPGGEMIRQAGGTEATALFYSMHPHNPAKNLQVLAKYRVGTMENEKFNFTFDSDFANDLKKNVGEFMKGKENWYAPMGFWFRTFLIMTFTVISEYLWMTTGSRIAMVAAGVLHALIGLAVQHDASHGAFSSSPRINALFSYGADWVGNSRWLWMQQHVIGHHPHTNMEGHDPDAHSAEPFLAFHMFPTSMRKYYMRFQAYYMHLVLALYGPSIVYNLGQLFTLNHGSETPTNPWITAKIPTAVLWRVFYWTRIVIAPYYLGVAPLWLCVVGIPAIAGSCLTFVFVVSHNFDGSDRFPYQATEAEKSGNEAVDWYKMQAETACSYGGFMSMYCTGGLNFQIEHHLFPRLCSWYYPSIKPIIEATCAKHNVRYVYYPTIVENLMSCLSYMNSTGAPEDARMPAVTAAEEKKVLDTPASLSYVAEDAHLAYNEMDVLPITVHGVTYNVKRWLPHHPGGDIMLHYVGRDASAVFDAMHGADAIKSLKRLPVVSDPKVAVETFRGKLQQEQRHTKLEMTKAQQAMIDDYNQLRKDFDADGTMDASVLWYLYKSVTTLGIGFAGLYVLASNGTAGTWGTTVLSSSLLGVSFQQLGWLAHDFAHHTCFKNRTVNTYLALFFGNFCQGFSVTWWRTRHNEHHAATNILEHDPDIDNLPALAWSKHDVDLALKTSSPTFLKVLKYQKYYFFVVLALLHLIWINSSLLFVRDMFSSANKFYRRMAPIEASLLAGHFAWRFVVLGLFSPSLSQAFVHFMITEFIGGFGIGIIVFANHYPVEKSYDDAIQCFPEMQLNGTLNVAPGLFVDWLAGGLNYQIEHHLFPTTPRHNLNKIMPRIKAYCAKHDLPYRAPGLLTATGNELRWLSKISDMVPDDVVAAQKLLMKTE